MTTIPPNSPGRTMKEAMEIGCYYLAQWRDPEDNRRCEADMPGCASIEEVAWYCWISQTIPACVDKVEFVRVLPGSTIGCRFVEPVAEFSRLA